MSNADLGNKFTHHLYEVLSEDTKKYTSTIVSGGGGTVSGGGGYVSGSTNAITSRVDYHSDQSVWVKSIATGKERKFQLNTFNIDVRPGHKILCVWDKKSDSMERVANLSTGDISYANGVHHFYLPDKLTFIQRVKFILETLFVSAVCTAPVLSLIFVFVLLKKAFMGKGFYFERDKFLSASLLGFMILYIYWILLEQSYELITRLITNHYYNFSSYLEYWIPSAAIVFLILFFERIFEVSKKRSNFENLNSYLSKLINDIKKSS